MRALRWERSSSPRPWRDPPPLLPQPPRHPVDHRWPRPQRLLLSRPQHRHLCHHQPQHRHPCHHHHPHRHLPHQLTQTCAPMLRWPRPPSMPRLLPIPQIPLPPISPSILLGRLPTTRKKKGPRGPFQFRPLLPSFPPSLALLWFPLIFWECPGLRGRPLFPLHWPTHSLVDEAVAGLPSRRSWQCPVQQEC